jgi:hypothetical protein
MKHSNLTRIRRVLEFYRKRGTNSEKANNVYRKILNIKYEITNDHSARL